MALLGRRTRVRQLDEQDRDAVLEMLMGDPVANVFVASRVLQHGVSRWRLGCPIWGFFRGRELESICHAGANMVPVNAHAEALAAFVDKAEGVRRCGSIVGESSQALELFRLLGDRWGATFSRAREVRASQPVMAIEGPPAVAPDPRVRRIDRSLLEPYFVAAVKMYEEEVGVSPCPNGDESHYRAYVARLIDDGHAYGIVSDDGRRVLYKSDIGSCGLGVGQVQGVWLDPELRGQGLAAPAMAAVVELVREEFGTVSLYVNDFNTRAHATYRRIGMAEVGEFATILY
ncbi:GNAT family N-acetyltransferase [Mariniluteicoccus endophyticus]